MNADEITVSDYMDAMAGQAARDIVAERVRQITVYDFDADHDDIHDGRQMAEAAAAYGLAYADRIPVPAVPRRKDLSGAHHKGESRWH